VNDKDNIISFEQIDHLQISTGMRLAANQDFSVVDLLRIRPACMIHNIFSLARIHAVLSALSDVPFDPAEWVSHLDKYA
jgi:hypothetical protein